MSELIPKGWDTKCLSEVCSFAIGGTPSRAVSEYWDSSKSIGQPWVSIRDLTSRVISETSEYITSEGIRNSNVKLVKKDTVLMSFKLSLGRVAIAGRDLYTNEAIAAFIPKSQEKLDNHFLYQGLQHWNLLENIDQAVKGVTLNKEKLGLIEALLPPLPEQQKIATILSSVDDVIEKTRTQIDKLKDLKTGMMQELLTKGIGHTEFKDSPVGRIPVSWECVQLSSLLHAIIDCEHKTAPYVESSKYLVVRTSNVRDGELIFDDMKYTDADAYVSWTQRAVPRYGDILFTREAPAGESCLVPEGFNVCMGQRMVLLRPKETLVSAEFLSLFLTLQKAKQAIYDLSIGTTVTRINIEDIKKIPCFVPPLAEQKKIVQCVESIANRLVIKRDRQCWLQRLKKALMQDLLTGKVHVKLDSPEVAAA